MAGGKWRETYLSAFDETSDATAVVCVRALRLQLCRGSRREDELGVLPIVFTYRS